MILRKYRLWCNTEEQWIYCWNYTLPIECPNDNQHSIDTNSVTIEGYVPDKIKNDDDFIEYYYWVDPINGHDNGEGTEENPYKTIQYTIASIPKNADSWCNVAIKLKSGTYNLAKTVIIDAFKGVGIFVTSDTGNADDVIINTQSGDKAFTITNNLTTVELANISIKCNGNDSIGVYALDSLFIKCNSIKFGSDGSNNTTAFFTNCTFNSVINCSNMDTTKTTYGLKSTCNKLIVIDDVSDFANTLVYPGTHVMNFSEYQDAINNKHFELHNLDSHIDVPEKPTTGNHVLEQQGDSTSFVWVESSKRKTAAILTYYSTASSVANQYIYCSGQPSNQVGYILPKNGKVVSISYMNKYGSTSRTSGSISIRKNGIETEIAKMNINSGQNREYTVNPIGSLTFSAGEWLSCYIIDGKLSKPLINIEIEWI